MRVRPVAEHDRAAWLRLFRAYIAFYRAAVPDEVVDATWLRLRRDEEATLIGLLAVDEGDVPCGLAHAVFHRSTWSPTWYCYLEDLFVDPPGRGKGAGRALIEAVYREADARGCTRTYWVTDAGNAAARALYDRVATKTAFVQYRR